MDKKGTYYNEIDPNAAEWIRQLITLRQIPDGEVDERSIVEVANDIESIKHFRQHHFFAGIAVWAYALRQAGWDDDRPVITGSCPCFVAGTFVMTEKGQVPIEQVRVGDRVLTHTGTFQKVLRVGNDCKDTVVVKGQGSSGVETTSNHPFYARKVWRDTRRISATSGKRLFSAPEWVEAEKLKGLMWAMPSEVPTIKMPIPARRIKGVSLSPDNSNKFIARVEHKGKQKRLGTYDTQQEAVQARWNFEDSSSNRRLLDATPTNWESIEFARFLGYWVGDGWTSSKSNQPGRVTLCGGHGDEEFIYKIALDAGIPSSVSTERTGARIRIHSEVLAQWLDENFGQGALNKSIPAWLHGMPLNFRISFLDGLFEADGSSAVQQKGGGKIRSLTTISKALAVGVRVLMNQLGKSVSVCFAKPRENLKIEGRSVKEKGHFRITEYETARSFFIEGIHGWGKVRSIESTGRFETVYNLEVESDNSYIADGIVVHNCQGFSVAGLQRGFGDDRHLWPYMLRIVSELRPSIVIGEQVSSKLAMQWWDLVAGDLESEGYAATAFDLEAAGCGAPHHRSRLFWVAHSDSYRNHSDSGRDREADTTQQELSSRMSAGTSCDDKLGNSTQSRCESQCESELHDSQQPRVAIASVTNSMVHADSNAPALDLAGSSRDRGSQIGGNGSSESNSGTSAFWDDAEWYPCRDGKYRPSGVGINPLAGVPGLDRGAIRHELEGILYRLLPPGHAIERTEEIEGIARLIENTRNWGSIKPSPVPMVDGLTARVGQSRDTSIESVNATQEARVMRLKGYGNAIVAPLTIEFIKSLMETIADLS